MKFKNDTNPHMIAEGLQNHIDMVHSILMVYMLKNNIKEIVAFQPDGIDTLVPLKLIFSKGNSLDDGKCFLSIKLDTIEPPKN